MEIYVEGISIHTTYRYRFTQAKFPQLNTFELPILCDGSGIIRANPVLSGSLTDPLCCWQLLEVTSVIRGVSPGNLSHPMMVWAVVVHDQSMLHLIVVVMAY